MRHSSEGGYGRGRGPDDERAFNSAYWQAHRELNPTREVVHLRTLAFAAAALRFAVRFAAGQSWFAREEDQYVALLHARQTQLGRKDLRPSDYDRLRVASRKLWDAREILHHAALAS